MEVGRALFIALVSLAAVASAGSLSAQERSAPFPLPEIKKDCTTCHLTEGTKTGTRLTKKLSDLCLDCHPDRVAPQEHLVGIAPSMAVKDLPLTGGKMTCITCHDPHKNAYGALLRMPETTLCRTCHPY